LEKTALNFVRNYSWLFGNSYMSEMTKNIEATWRYKWDNSISNLNVIDSKDSYAVAYVSKVNKFLEQEIDKKIEQDRLFSLYPIMLYYTKAEYCGESRYETFFFWKNAKDVNSLKDIHIYRWTYWNYKNLDILSNLSSRWNASTVSTMNELFDMQIQANRWFNILWSSKKDADIYKKECSRDYIVWYWYAGCKNRWRKKDEKLTDWVKRVYGWFSPLNLKITGWSWIDPLDYKFNYENYKYAWHPSTTPTKDGTLFDMAWSNINKNKQSTIYTDTIEWIKQYASVWRVKHSFLWNTIDWICNGLDDDWANKVWWKYVDLNLPVRFWDKNIWDTIKKWSRVYKYIDTRIKHTSPTYENFKKFNIW
jgi:hypothetical protein